MSIQRLGARKLRKLAAETGLDLQMAWSWGHPAKVMLRTFADEHYTYDRRTRQVTADPDGHVSSCPGHCGTEGYDQAEWERGGQFLAFGHPQQR